MASFHDTAKGFNNASGTSVGTTDTLAVTAGDLIYVCCKWEGANGAVATVSDGVDTYVEATAVQNHTNNDLHERTLWTTASTTGSRTITFNLGAARVWRYVAAISFTPAANRTWSLGNTSQGTPNNTAAFSAGTAAYTGAGVAMVFNGIYGSRTLTGGSGWTVPAELTTDLITGEYQLIASGSGSLTGDGDHGAGVEWLSHMAIFNEVAATVAVGSRAKKKSRRPGTTAPGNVGQFVKSRRDFSTFSTPASGVVGTGAVGTVAPAVSVALTGVAGTGAVGTVSAVNDGAVAVTGVQAAGTVGTATPTLSVPITGVVATGGVGTVSPAVATLNTGSRRRLVSLPAGESIFTVNRFYRPRRNSNAVPAATSPLTGNTATGAVGTVTPVITKALSGNAATVIAGTVASGASAEGSRRRAGGVHPGSGPYSFGRYFKTRRNKEGAGTSVQALTGVGATVSVGSVSAARSIALSGVAGVGTVGSVGASQAGNATLTTVAGVSAVGSVAVSTSVGLTGVQALGAAGTVTPLVGSVIEMSGVQATAAPGALGVSISIRLTGVQASATIGSMISGTPGTWVPVNSTATVEGWTPINT